MFPGLTLPFVTLAFVKAPSQFPCSTSLTVGWPDIPSLPDSCLTSPAADQRLTSLSLPGKRMLSLSPAVPHFDHLIKVVPAAHLHCATGMSLGPSSTAVQGVLCGKVFWDRINVLLLYRHPLILVSLRNLHWIMCLGGGGGDYKSHWEDDKQACVVISKDVSEGNVSDPKISIPTPHQREHGGIVRVEPHKALRIQETISILQALMRLRWWTVCCLKQCGVLGWVLGHREDLSTNTVTFYPHTHICMGIAYPEPLSLQPRPPRGLALQNQAPAPSKLMK